MYTWRGNFPSSSTVEMSQSARTGGWERAAKMMMAETRIIYLRASSLWQTYTIIYVQTTRGLFFEKITWGLQSISFRVPTSSSHFIDGMEAPFFLHLGAKTIMTFHIFTPTSSHSSAVALRLPKASLDCDGRERRGKGKKERTLPKISLRKWSKPEKSLCWVRIMYTHSCIPNVYFICEG